MTHCTQESLQFPVCKRRRVEAHFQGGDITSDGGVLPLYVFCHKVGYIVGIAKNKRLKGDGETPYDKLYCAPGEMENRIREQ